MSNPRAFFATAALLLSVACASHPATGNRYALNVVGDERVYDDEVRADAGKRLVPLAAYVPGVILDLRYATDNNFMHATLYPIAGGFLRAPAALALADVQEDLASGGLGLKVFDAYRPYAITVRMWEPIRNADFVADPAKGSRHNRGAAVDLTLVDLKTEKELAMPTPFDDFTTKARQDYGDLPADVLANRALLKDVMVRHGFEPLPSEWWHFDYAGWQKFELLDLDLRMVARKSIP